MTSPFRFLPQHIKLSDALKGPESLPQKVQLMRTCKFSHPRYGNVEITRLLFEEMVTNFDKKVRGIELMIDYSHESDREAAGWIKGLEIVDNQELSEAELWAVASWTPEGARTLCDKEFAYLSADFDPSYKDPESGVTYGAVLLGAGLTNRPVIKKMTPAIQLSESELYKENNMTPEETKAASDKLAQVDKLMQELGVTTPEELMAKIADMKSQNDSLSQEKELTEKTAQTDKLFSEGKITKAQADIALKLEKNSFQSFIKLAEMNEGVKTKEQGHSGTPAKVTKVNPQDKVIELAEKKMTENKIGMSKAIKLVLSENADLKKAYYAEQGDEEEVEE